MGKPTGFMEFAREVPKRRPVKKRLHDWLEVYQDFPPKHLQKQAARCMDCGIPFCHQGCPLGNIIPDWNDLVYRDLWREAIAPTNCSFGRGRRSGPSEPWFYRPGRPAAAP